MTSSTLPQQVLSNRIAEAAFFVLALAVGPAFPAELGGANKLPFSELRALAIGSLEELMSALDESTEGQLVTAERDRLRAGHRCCTELVQSIAGWEGVLPLPAAAEQAFDKLFETFGIGPHSTMKAMIAATLTHGGGQRT